MAVYLILIGLSVFSFVFGHTIGNRRNANRSTLLVFFIGMILLIWLRAFSIGTDTYNYLNMYERAKNIGFGRIKGTYDGEYGYFALNMLIAAIYDNHHFFLLCIGLVSLVPVIFFYIKNSGNALITIGLFLVFLFSVYFSAFRQTCAMAFAIPAYYAAREKKAVPFVLWVIVAMTFHTSAFALFLLYPVYHMQIKKKWFYLLGFVFVITYLFRVQIFSLMLRFMSSRYQDNYANLTSSSAITVLLLMIMLVVYTYVTSDDEMLDKEAIGLRNLLVLSMALQMFASINSVAMRLNYYYLLFVPITVSKYVHFCNIEFAQVARLAEWILATFFIIYFIVNMYSGSDILRIFPYEFYFS